MRRLLPLTVLLGALSARAEASQKQWTATVDPLTVLLGFVHVQVEHSVGERHSVYLGPSLKVFDSPLGVATGPFRGYGVEAGARAFVWGTAPAGAWVLLRGVVAAVVSAEGTQPGGYLSVLGGYTAILGPGLVLSGGLGVSYFAYGPSFGIHGFLPAAHTALGWAW